MLWRGTLGYVRRILDGPEREVNQRGKETAREAVSAPRAVLIEISPDPDYTRAATFVCTLKVGGVSRCFFTAH